MDHPLCKQTFLALQGPQYLISILKSNVTYLKLIYAVIRCIRSISTDTQNKASLISLGNFNYYFIVIAFFFFRWIRNSSSNITKYL